MPNSGTTQIYGSLRLTEGGVVLGDIAGQAPAIEKRYARIRVTSAEILALNATPKVLAPAPGAGKFLVLTDASIALDATATAYAGVASGEDLVIRYTNGSGTIVSTTLETTGFIDQTTDQVRTFKAIATDYTPAVNAPLVLHLLAGEITTGTGELIVNIEYAIHETGL